MKVIKKIRYGNNKTVKDFIIQLESLIYRKIRENFPNYWDSDVINLCLLKEMSSLFNDKIITIPGNTLKTNWRLYKLRNDVEKKMGDIAIILNCAYHDGHCTEGAIFWETHIKDPDKNTFSSIKSNILKRMNYNSPHSQVVLYDYDSISGMAFPAMPESVIGDSPDTWNNWIPFTHAVAIPANLAVLLGQKTTGLYKASLPLAYQLCYRYFYGLDLDYQNPAVETAKGFRSDKGNAKYLVIISVAHGGANLTADIDHSTELYEELE